MEPAIHDAWNRTACRCSACRTGQMVICRFPTTRSSATRGRWRWSPATARSIGCACPMWTAPRSLPRCSTGTAAAASSSAPPGEAQITRRYAPGSAILITRFTTSEGVFELTDFMPMALNGADGPIEPARRVIRIAEAISGNPRIAVHFAPRPDYARTTPDLRRAGRKSWIMADGRDFLLLQSDVPLAPATDGSVVGERRLTAGRKVPVHALLLRKHAGNYSAVGRGLRPGPR